MKPQTTRFSPDQRECRRASAARACTRIISASLPVRGRRAAGVFPDRLAPARWVEKEPTVLRVLLGGGLVWSGLVPELEAEHDRNSKGKLRQEEEGGGGGGQGAAAESSRAIWQRAGRDHRERGRTGEDRTEPRLSPQCGCSRTATTAGRSGPRVQNHRVKNHRSSSGVYFCHWAAKRRRNWEK